MDNTTKHCLSILFSFTSLFVYAQDYIVGQSYFSDNEYSEYIHGTLPIIISAPHDGEKRPDDIPDRTCPGCVLINDTNTQELAREVLEELEVLTGCFPYVLINRLHRSKLDANREINEAADGNAAAEAAWGFYHDHALEAQTDVLNRFGKGLFIDLHGHGHEIQRLELGYLLSRSDLENNDGTLNDKVSKSSINHLASNHPLNFDLMDLVQGNFSLGELFQKNDVKAVPSQSDLYPEQGDSYFKGGYNTQVYGSRDGGAIDAIQIECHQDVRFDHELRKAFAKKLALVLVEYISIHYFENLEWQACGLSKTETSYQNLIWFPNPTSNRISINEAFGYNSVTLMSGLGIELSQAAVQNGKAEIFISDFSNGLYFLKFNGLQDSHTQSVIISN